MICHKSALRAVMIAVLCMAAATSMAARPAKPNIIVIYTDDQGFGDASCLNSEAKFQTPNMDRLANEGISFTNGHSADAVCTPSRYGLLTGRYCWRTEKKKGVLGAESTGLIKDERMTLASLLRDNGYNTAMVGKWHLGMDFPGTPKDRDWSQPVKDMPLDKGFDYFYGIPASLNYGVLAWFEGRHAKTPPTMYTAKKKNERHVDYRIMPPYQNTPQETHEILGKRGMEVAPDFIDNQCLTRFTDKAIEWMQGKTDDAKSGKPFFLYLPYTSPHYPVCPLPEFWGKGGCGAYGEFVIETDHHIGRILDFLEKSELDKDTMIVFTSDNGPERSWKERITEFGHDSSYIYRGGKREIYEGGHRVPFFIRWPAGIKKPGRTWDKLVGQVDLLATFADLIGADLPPNAGEDSQSFAKVLTKSKARYERAPLINHSIKGQFAVTEGRWKLVLPLAKLPMELYDLSADPAEENNVLAEHPKHIDRLKKKATDIVLNGRTTPGPAQPNDSGYWKHLQWITEAEYNARQASAHAEEDYAPDKIITYKTLGDIELTLHVFNPQDHKPTDKRTAMVFFFGGGWVGGKQEHFYQQAKSFAAHGAVAISTGYRIFKKHNTTPFECVMDGKSAIRWVRRNAAKLGIDPDRIVAAGGSAGGHVAACTGVIEGHEEEGEDLSISSRPNAMILYNPVIDTTEKGYGVNKVGHDRKTEISPCHHVRKGIPPTLIFHGTADTTVPYENVVRFNKLMKEAGNSCSLVSFEGKGHGFFNGSFFRPSNTDVDFNITMDKSIGFLATLGFLEEQKAQTK